MLSIVRAKNAIRILVGWASVSLAVWAVTSWFERTSLEKQAGLRDGLLNEFHESEIDFDNHGNELLSIRFRIFAPYSKNTVTKFPVLLYLHGSGERGNDNALQLKSLPSMLTELPYRNEFPCYIIAPQCPMNMSWTTFRRNFLAESTWNRDPIVRIVEQMLENPNVDRDRVYLVGFSMGSFGAWDLAADYPDLFAAVVPIAGGGPGSLAEALVDVPIWAVHGDQDRTCPVEQTRKIVVELERLGANVHYTELCGVAHASWQPAFSDTRDLIDWMFRQRKMK